MTADHPDREAHQVLRRAPRDHRRRPRGRRGRGLRLPRAERRRQDDDDPDAARPHPADERAGARLRHRVERGPGRHPPPGRLHPRRVHALRPADRRPDASSTSPTSGAAWTAPTRRRSSSASTSTRARKFKEYSKGNKQKIGLVIALQHRPELLILDEPTSGLDPLVQQTFYALVREASAEGRTVFLSSHILSEVERTCDRVAIIRDGRLVKVDRVEALRDLAHHQVELRFAGGVPVAAFEALPGVCEVRGRGPHAADARVRADHAGRPGGRAAMSCSTSSAASRASRRPSSPQYGHEAAEVAGHDHRASATSRRRAAPTPIPLEPHLRLRQRLRQDAPRLAARGHHRRRAARRRCCSPAASAFGEAYATLAVAGGAGGAWSPSLPPVDGRHLRQPVPDVSSTLGGSIAWKYGRVVRAHRRALVDPRAVGTLAGEARRGSLEFVAVTPARACAGSPSRSSSPT